MSLATLLLGKTLVGAFFAIVASAVPLVVGVLRLGVAIADAALLLAGTVLASLAFSAFGLVFASIPTRSVGNIMMPSTLIRWPLLFISGIFVPYHHQFDPMRDSLLSGRVTGVTLVDKGNFNGITGRFLDLLGQFTDLGAFLFVGWRDIQRQASGPR